jgi:hypothetical protein
MHLPYLVGSSGPVFSIMAKSKVEKTHAKELFEAIYQAKKSF